MPAETVQTLAVLSAVLGLVCFIWPSIRRLRGGGSVSAGAPSLRSPLWWAGLGFTAFALILLRFVPEAV